LTACGVYPDQIGTVILELTAMGSYLKWPCCPGAAREQGCSGAVEQICRGHRLADL